MQKNTQDFGQQVARLLPTLFRELTRRQKEFLAGNIAISHLVVLEYLRENGPSRMSRLAGALNMTTSAVTAIVDKMIDEGFVQRERSQSDRRVVFVRLKTSGEKTAQRVNRERKEMANEIFSVLTEKERREYLRMLRKVCESLMERTDEN